MVPLRNQRRTENLRDGFDVGLLCELGVDLDIAELVLEQADLAGWQWRKRSTRFAQLLGGLVWPVNGLPHFVVFRELLQQGEDDLRCAGEGGGEGVSQPF